MINLHLRFYEELNDFLPLERRKVCFTHSVSENSSIKDVIESLGVPHTEVDLILVNRRSVNFSYKVHGNDHISVYPVFETLDITDVIHLRPKPLRETCFIADVHLGKLTKYLRLLGFDVAYNNQFSDETIIIRSQNEKRIILTRDTGMLKNKQVSHGYWVRNIDSKKQAEEILHRFDLYRQCQPFARCIECNGMLKPIDKNKISANLPPLTLKHYENFTQCTQCKRNYWEGTHYQKLKDQVERFLNAIKH